MPLDALPDLLCAEGEAAFAYDDEPAEHRTASDFPGDSDESFAEFLEGESDYWPRYDYRDRFRAKSLDAFARRDSIVWMLKVCSFYNFEPLTAYLAVNYFDRFLSAHRLPETKGWVLQLVSVACLSLAAKMEETLVPSLLDLQMEGAKFIFEPRTICKMELLVLSALKWRLRSVTPFTFIDFFAYKADPSGAYTRYLVSEATQIILASIHDIEFLDHCPSSMAAAAIICAAGETSNLAIIDPVSATSWCIGLTKEGVTKCCHVMREAARENKPTKPQTRVTTRADASPSSSSPPPNKRRKLI